MGKKILLIDDSAMLRRIAASVLGAQPARYELLAATRATEGFARACNSGVDLILADQRLQDLPGEALPLRLLADPRTARVPIVLLVGRAATLPPLETMPANIVETLRKPFAPEQLVTVVGAIFDLLRAGEDLAGLRAKLHPAPTPRDDQTDPPFRAAVQEAPSGWAAKPTLSSLAAAAVAPAGSTPGELSRAFVFQRNVGSMSIPAALREVATESLTGVLRFRPPGSLPVEVYTENGRVVVVTTHDGLGYAEGASSVVPPKVSPATLEAAVHEQSRGGIPFLLTLGARGLLSKAAAEALLHRFGQRCFARLWTVRAADLPCEFEKLSALPGFVLRLQPRSDAADEWLLGTLRHLRVGDLADISRHEGLVGMPCYRQNGQSLLQTLRLDNAERAFAEQVNGSTDLPTLGKLLGLSPDSAFLTLYRFRCLETMDYRPAPPAFMVTPRTRLRRVLPLER